MPDEWLLALGVIKERGKLNLCLDFLSTVLLTAANCMEYVLSFEQRWAPLIYFSVR